MKALNVENHPCFNPRACHKVGRVHLPVAPRCNVQCNFCNRKFDCVNESRPGVTSTLLSPGQAMVYLDKLFDHRDDLTVIGIAGPGDPFANPEETMETLRRARSKYPEALLCVATNGLGLIPYIDELSALKVTHVTLTVNAVDPAIAAKVYAWGRHERKILRGQALGEHFVTTQLEAIRRLKAAGNILIKINSIILPGINDEHIPEIARVVSDLGADVMNCIPLIPTQDTAFEDLPAPDAKTVARLRFQCGDLVRQMLHCARCRSDACGTVGDENSDTVIRLMHEAAALPHEPSQDRPYVAVASLEGAFINQHLGEADRFLIFRECEDGDFEHIAVRRAPTPGSGGNRWKQLATTLADCRALLVSAAGPTPTETLRKHGLPVHTTEGLIEEALACVFEGRPLPKKFKEFSCGKGITCTGTGTGCG